MAQGPTYIGNAADIGSASSVTVTSSALPTGASTSAKQDTGNSSLTTIATNTAKKFEIQNAAAITPNDSTELDYDWMYIGGTMATDGTVAPVDIAVTLQDDSAFILYNVPNGAEYIMDIKKIRSTGTSAGANVVCGRIDRTS
jgi:hypothetical protein